MEGWIKIHKKSLENPVFKKPLVWHFFNYCLLKANFKSKTILWNKKEITVERGSFIFGRKKAADATGLSEQNIRTAFEILSNLNMIKKSTIKSTNRFSYVTICNYETYQQIEIQINQQTNQVLTKYQPSTNQVLTTIEEEKENKEKQESKEKRLLRKNKQKNLFDLFWKEYPNKKSKGYAEKTWKKINPDQQLFEVMILKLKEAQNSTDWTKQNGQYIPHPSTWLNAKGWEDEYRQTQNFLSDKGIETAKMLANMNFEGEE